MLRDLLRAILVLIVGGYGISAIGLALVAALYVVDHPPGAPLVLEAAVGGVVALPTGLALLWLARRFMYPPPTARSQAESDEMGGRQQVAPGAAVWSRYRFTTRRLLLVTAILATWFALLAMADRVEAVGGAAFTAWMIAVAVLPALVLGLLHANFQFAVAVVLAIAVLIALTML